MQDFEKLGPFYLGRPFDLQQKTAISFGAEDNVAAVTQRLADLEAQFNAETETLKSSLDPQPEQLDKVQRKQTSNVKLLTLVWAPYLQDAQQRPKPAWE